jgi:hypothetical protein
LHSVQSLVAAYKMTSRVQDSPHIRSRRRIWGLVSHISDLIGLRCSDKAISPNIPAKADEREWLHVSGDMYPNEHRMDNGTGCKLLRSFQVSVVELTRIEIFTCTTGPVAYICGMHLQNGDSSQTIGYCNSGKSTSVDATGLAGFIVAVGSRGIHALQVVYQDGHRSTWVGRPDSCLLTERLNAQPPILALQADFDVSNEYADDMEGRPKLITMYRASK